METLIGLGSELLEGSGNLVTEILARCRKYEWINMPGRDRALRIASSRSQHELALLIVGITFAEREFRWKGGSVAIVSTLFAHLKENSSEDVYIPIADWVIEHRGNPYIPYGTQMYIGRTHAECMDDRARRIKAGIEYQKRLELFETQMQELHVMLAKQRANTARDRGNSEHVKIVSLLSKQPVIQQLSHIAADEAHSIGFYPKNIPASVTREHINELDEEIAGLLRKKLIGKTWGPWKRVKRMLDDSGITGPQSPKFRDFL